MSQLDSFLLDLHNQQCVQLTLGFETCVLCTLQLPLWGTDKTCCLHGISSSEDKKHSRNHLSLWLVSKVAIRQSELPTPHSAPLLAPGTIWSTPRRAFKMHAAAFGCVNPFTTHVLITRGLPESCKPPVQPHTGFDSPDRSPRARPPAPSRPKTGLGRP